MAWRHWGFLGLIVANVVLFLEPTHNTTIEIVFILVTLVVGASFVKEWRKIE